MIFYRWNEATAVVDWSHHFVEIIRIFWIFSIVAEYGINLSTKYLLRSLFDSLFRFLFWLSSDLLPCQCDSRLYYGKYLCRTWSSHHKYEILLSYAVVKFKIKKPIVVQSARFGLVLWWEEHFSFFALSFFFFLFFFLSFSFFCNLRTTDHNAIGPQSPLSRAVDHINCVAFKCSINEMLIH